VAAFGAYSCMYAFRKPFTAGTYGEGSESYKATLVTAQVLGYTLSKFIGIKVIAEMPPARRAITLLALVGFAEVALFFFGLTPAPYNALWLFLNGLPLGMVFGLVLGFLEGRRHTEALAAALCVSFIVADGATKSVGAALLDAGVTESPRKSGRACWAGPPCRPTSRGPNSWSLWAWRCSTALSFSSATTAQPSSPRSPWRQRGSSSSSCP
jgi:hypothetical protein